MKNHNLTKTLTRFALIVALALATLPACSKEHDLKHPTTPTKTITDFEPRKFIKNARSTEEFDINKDGKYDQIYYYDKNKKLFLISRDLNFDGLIDVYEIYENDQHTQSILDLNYDGVFDLVNYYENEKLTKKHISADFNATSYAIQYFDQNGELVKMEKDTNADRKIDTWEHYRPGQEKPYKIELDTNADTIPDKIENLDEPPEEIPQTQTTPDTQ